MAVLASPNVGVRRRALLVNFRFLFAPPARETFRSSSRAKAINLTHGAHGAHFAKYHIIIYWLAKRASTPPNG